MDTRTLIYKAGYSHLQALTLHNAPAPAGFYPVDTANLDAAKAFVHLISAEIGPNWRIQEQTNRLMQQADGSYRIPNPLLGRRGFVLAQALEEALVFGTLRAWAKKLPPAPSAMPTPPAQAEKRAKRDLTPERPQPTWLELNLVNEEGKPVANQAYSVKDVSGKEFSGTTDAKGKARIEGVLAGSCAIGFPSIEGWHPGGATTASSAPIASTHTIAQGETLTDIAKQNGFHQWQTLYNHDDNAEFRKLRSNPNIIYPGDKINIPMMDDLSIQGGTEQAHKFVLKQPKQQLELKLENQRGGSFAGKKVILNIAGEQLETTVTDDGLVKFDLPEGDLSSGALDVYMNDDDQEPVISLEVKLGHLDPVESLSGVQARCNALGYDCGVADGIMGSKTEEGIKAFQAANDLTVDGKSGPNTEAKLLEKYGC